MDLLPTILYATAGLFGFFIWIFMLIDAIKAKRKSWIYLIIFIPVIGAIIYAFMIKLRKKQEQVDVVQELTQQPQQQPTKQEQVVQELKQTIPPQ